MVVHEHENVRDIDGDWLVARIMVCIGMDDEQEELPG